MALHPDFPESPYAILNPDIRWFPAGELLRKSGYEKLLPPLVDKLRKEVKAWRDKGYDGATKTSISLLRWWFQTDHFIKKANGDDFQFKYYFAQREAVETVIYLYDVVKIKDKYDLIRYDSSNAVSASMFDEDWRRFVIKMATGAGKTKVLSLLLLWSFFHKTYEANSQLARNFLLITPNIIVLDRIRADFDGLKIFYEDPMLPDNGFEGQNWHDDFQLTLHIQDEIGTVNKTGNVFLTNIHRVYNSKDSVPAVDDENATDYFLGEKPVVNTSDSKVNLGEIVRDIDELMVLNDEAHHIHNKKLAWFKSIEDMHNRLKMKGSFLSLQVDVTATPKHDNGAIFAQTICDYPLVEAIYQNVVKHPVLPDLASRAKLQPHKSSKFTEKYKDYIHLGFLEWKKAYDEHIKMNKKAVLFIMTDDTKNCDEVSQYLQNTYQELKGAVLTIHTNNNGEISETVKGKGKEELDLLRREANGIDTLESPYKAIVSVLMLKEGWDVKNVTTIVGLRAYTANANILPEQTLGRGLRCMYREQNIEELVSVVGTDPFMDFVESIKNEGVELERRPMGGGGGPIAPVIVEVDNENVKKDIDLLDIEIPLLTPRIYREYKNISVIDISSFGHKKIKIKNFSEAEKREIVFRDIATGEITHRTEMDNNFVPNYQSVIGYFTQVIMGELRLISGYDIIYGKVKEFITNFLFENPIELEDSNSLRNLSELEASKTVIENFKKKINELTVVDRGEAEIKNYIKVRNSRPFVAKEQQYLIPKKSVFNKIIGDSHLELEFASFLEQCDDIVSFAKNYYSVHFKIDYQDADGNIRDYFPDFLVKVNNKEIFIVETKGREDLDDIEKIKRLEQWCDDINRIQCKVKYDWLLVRQNDYERYKPKEFQEAVKLFHKE